MLFGPQNWVLRMLHDHGKLPESVEQLFHPTTKKSGVFASGLNETERAISPELPHGQIIVSAHTSDGSPPLELSHNDIDPREIHQVSVPYSQLTYRRFYDWPPEPQYAKIQSVCSRGGDNSVQNGKTME